MTSLKSFGHYAPNLSQKCILSLVKGGLGRGGLKRNFARLFQKNRHANAPVDISYQGVKLRLYPDTNLIDNRILFSSKTRDKRELDAIAAHTSPDTVFIDIGANIGYYSLNAAKFGAGKVIALEPSPITFQRLQDNIDLNSFQSIVTPMQIGVGGEKSVMTLHVLENNLGASSVLDHGEDAKAVEVDILPLSDILKQNNVAKADIIKIDIEGLEDKVLFPYFQSLSTELYPDLIIIEDNSDQWDKNILEWMLENGYHIVEKTRGNLILKNRR